MSVHLSLNPLISVIVPCLNEAANLSTCLNSIRAHLPGCELIVIDANSMDGSARIAAEFADSVVQSARGRGVQCRVGSDIARGELLIFLHADSQLQAGALASVVSAFRDPTVCVATFKIQFSAPQRRYRFLELCSRFDSILTTYGDQGVIVRRDFYNVLGGMPELPLFEDVAFFQRARRIDKIVKLQSNVVTSARRFQRLGFWRTHALNSLLICGYLVGVNPVRLHRIYYAI
jgi:rSAM/selenodomain-associated transferase 2